MAKGISERTRSSLRHYQSQAYGLPKHCHLAGRMVAGYLQGAHGPQPELSSSLAWDLLSTAPSQTHLH